MESCLRDLGLTRLETKVLQALAASSGKTAKEVSSETGVGTEAVYRLLYSLTKKRLVSSFGKRPRRYLAFPADIGLKNLMDDFQRQAEIFFGRNIAYLPSASLRVINSREIHRLLGAKIFKQAKKEVLVVASGTGDLDPEFTKTMADAIKRGVSHKIIALTLNESNYQQLKNLQKNGVEVRHRPGKGFNMAIYDRTIFQLSFRIEEETKEKRGFVANNPCLASFLGEFFDFLWKTSNSI